MSNITQKTKLIALIGYPLGYTFSHLMHNAAINTLNMDYVYLTMPVPPGQLTAAVQGIRAFRIAGNVTTPHKDEIMPFLDYLTDDAEISGSVNTFYWQENKLVGDNTDVQSFMDSLRDNDIDIAGRTITIIGSGGSARSVAAACAQAGAKAIITYSKKLESVLKFVHDMGLLFSDTVWIPHSTLTTMFVEDFVNSHLVVNASPVGMFPNPQDTPLDETFLRALLPDTHVYDLVYNPVETTFLKIAKEKGLKTYDGLNLLVRQGGVSFKRWTGRDAPLEIMEGIMKKHIEQFIEKEKNIKPIDIYKIDVYKKIEEESK